MKFEGRKKEAKVMLARAESVSSDIDESVAGASDAAEKRAKRRHATCAQVGLMEVGASEDFCRVRNISTTGLMAQVYRRLAVGDDVRIKTKSGQSLEGSVVWTADRVPDLASRVVYEIGVKFCGPIDVEPILSMQFANEDGNLQRSPRIGVETYLGLIVGHGRRLSGSLCDISQGGAKVQISHALVRGTNCSLILRGLPPLKGAVQWTHGARIGVAFDRAIRLETLIHWIQDRRGEAVARPDGMDQSHRLERVDQAHRPPGR